MSLRPLRPAAAVRRVKLFHGTNGAFTEPITRTGLRMSQPPSARIGVGVYFTPDFETAKQIALYTTGGKRRGATVPENGYEDAVVFECDVVCGRMYDYSAHNRNESYNFKQNLRSALTKFSLVRQFEIFSTASHLYMSHRTQHGKQISPGTQQNATHRHVGCFHHSLRMSGHVHRGCTAQSSCVPAQSGATSRMSGVRTFLCRSFSHCGFDLLSPI